ncbi:general amidase-B, partial [Aspergillus sclerotialis]
MITSPPPVSNSQTQLPSLHHLCSLVHGQLIKLETFQKLQELHMARQKVSVAWRQKWVDLGLDVILAPGSQRTAVAHDTYGWPPYTML